MKRAEARHAADLVDALEGLARVRKGVREKVKFGVMYVEIGAFEHEGESGGTGHGSALVPVTTGLRIVAFAKAQIKRELKALGVKP